MADKKRFDQEALDRHLTQLGWSAQRLAVESKSHPGVHLNERNLRKILRGAQQPWPATARRIADILEANGRDASDLWVYADDPGARPVTRSTAANPPPPNTAVNPFNPWTAVLPPVFVGRTRALRDLESAAWDGRGVSLLGEWRIGKTSLLHTWAARALELGFAVRLLSGQGPERQGHSALVDAVVDGGPSDMARADGGRGPTVPESADAAADRLGHWCSAQRSASDGRCPILLLDEAEGLLGHWEPSFPERLRGLLTARSLSLVLATRRTLPEVYADLGRVSPFANMLESVRIGLLEPGAAATLLARGAAGLEPDDPGWVLDQAGRHPFFLTLLARRLFDARADGPDTDWAAPRALALARFRDEAAQQFALWWPGLAERDRQRLRRAAAGGTATDADDGDDDLCRRGLLTEDHQPFARVLSEWLNRKD